MYTYYYRHTHTHTHMHTHTHGSVGVARNFGPGGRDGISQQSWEPIGKKHVVVHYGRQGVKERAVINEIPQVRLIREGWGEEGRGGEGRGGEGRGGEGRGGEERESEH